MTSEHPRQYVRFTHGRFAVQRFWGELPDSVTVGIFSTVAVGRDGTVYVAQRAGPPVLVFAPDGTFRHAWPAGLALLDREKMSTAKFVEEDSSRSKGNNAPIICSAFIAPTRNRQCRSSH